MDLGFSTCDTNKWRILSQGEISDCYTYLQVLFLESPIIHAHVLQFNMTFRLIELLSMSGHKVCSNNFQKALGRLAGSRNATRCIAIKTAGSYSG